MRLLFKKTSPFGYYNKINLSTSGSTFKVIIDWHSLLICPEFIGKNCYLFLIGKILNTCPLESWALTIWSMLTGISRKGGISLGLSHSEKSASTLSHQVYTMESNSFKDARPTRMKRGKLGSSGRNVMPSGWKNHLSESLFLILMADNCWIWLRSWLNLRKDGFLPDLNTAFTFDLSPSPLMMLWEWKSLIKLN